NLPAAKGIDDGVTGKGLNAATRAHAAKVAPLQHSVRLNGAGLVNHPASDYPRRPDLLYPAPELLAPVERARLKKAGVRERLNVRRTEVHHRVDIASVEGGAPRLDYLHVPLRHRLPPFLGKAFGGSSGSV